MPTARKIIAEIEQLPSKERRRVLKQLERSVAARRRVERSVAPQQEPYAALLEMAGMGRSSAVDVSLDKYHHLGHAYGPTAPRK